MTRQTKTIKISTNLLADLLIRETFPLELLEKREKREFTKLSRYTVFNLVYGC